ncbi:B12-binding domain-containing protein [Ornithinibacillus scapharcae]|uniref:B12-binding domain-containing protein n=1 Tax=Ornithinibacillus scapharcae TaxID=1147159 RepID=UPI000225BCAB|nr:B12-binding domain-containing protein [Ornithinibacillus scapharcae]
MKKLALLAGLVLMMVLAACSPEADEVLDFHNGVVDNVKPKIEEIPEIYNNVFAAATEEEAIEVFDNELMPLMKEIEDYFNKQELEHDVAKEYHGLYVDLVKSMSDVLAKEKEYLTALTDPNSSEDDVLALEEELNELNKVAEDKDKAVTDHWESLQEEYDFVDEEEE